MNFSLAGIVSLFNVDNNDGLDQEARFEEAVEFLRKIMLNMINLYMSKIEGLRSFDISQCEFSPDGRTVIFEQNLPATVTGAIIDSDPAFKNIEYYAVQNKEGYGIYLASVEEGSRESRNPEKIPRSCDSVPMWRPSTECLALMMG